MDDCSHDLGQDCSVCLEQAYPQHARDHFQLMHAPFYSVFFAWNSLYAICVQAREYMPMPCLVA